MSNLFPYTPNNFIYGLSLQLLLTLTPLHNGNSLLPPVRPGIFAVILASSKNVSTNLHECE